MMLHRHFESESNKNITTTVNMMRESEYVSEVFPPEEAPAEAPKRRGRPKKTEE